MIVLETINPACWVAFFESYIRDLTHVRPLHPETLQYLLRASGFHDVDDRLHVAGAESARLEHVPPPAMPKTARRSPTSSHAFNDNVAKLNARLFTYQDYAAIGRR